MSEPTEPITPSDAPAPFTIGQIKAAAVNELRRIDGQLEIKRGERDKINAEIRKLVTDREEAQRYVTASEPRKRKTT